MRKHRTLALGAVMLALLVSACAPGGGGESPVASEPATSQAADLPEITIGSAGFYEAAMVAEIYAQALEAEGFTVERRLELGERDAVQAAFDAGEIDLAPEYLGGLASFLEAEATADADETHENMVAALEPLGLTAFGFTPGTDADGFVVRQETADQLGLATLSDLAEAADELVWGIAPACMENPLCGPGLNEVYGIDLSTVETETLTPCSTEMAEALNNSAIDVAQVCTTQPDIERFNFALLDDDQGLQPAQNLAPVLTQELADAGGETLESTLGAVSELLTTEELTSLGVLVAVEQQSFADVAEEWLSTNGLN